MLLRRASFIQQSFLLVFAQETFQSAQRNRRRFLIQLLGQQWQFQNQRQRRRAWAWPRPQNWFRVLLANPALDVLWKEHFRVTRTTFKYLCDLVRPDLQKQYTRMRSPVSVEERVGLEAVVCNLAWDNRPQRKFVESLSKLLLAEKIRSYNPQ